MGCNMTLDKIKTYEEMWAYAKKIGYENLTDKDIEQLHDVVNRICDAQIAALPEGPSRSTFKLMYRCFANSIDYKLETCTPEREMRIQNAILKCQQEMGFVFDGNLGDYALK